MMVSHPKCLVCYADPPSFVAEEGGIVVVYVGGSVSIPTSSSSGFDQPSLERSSSFHPGANVLVAGVSNRVCGAVRSGDFSRDWGRGFLMP